MSEKIKNNLIILGLIAAAVLAHGLVVQNSFLEYDDAGHITDNPNVKNGITWEAVQWAFTSVFTDNSMPLTWLSHMLDCSLFGLHPQYHHLVSLLFHIFNVLLIFNILKYSTGTIWPSVSVAALFAIHPVNVEPVAWLAARNHLLNVFFCLLTISAYIRYCKTEKKFYYLFAIIFFELSLMSKASVIMLPFVLLILDYWPLGRFEVSKIRTLIKEKIPFLILSFLSSSILVFLYQSSGRIWTFAKLPVFSRLLNSLAAYSSYVEKIIWPSKLAVLYPYPQNGLPGWQYTLSFLILAVITILILINRRSRPYLFSGWFLFLIVLLPVIGFIQTGAHFIADRYLYFSCIGIFIMAVWLFSELVGKKVISKAACSFIAILIGGCLLAASFNQGRYWKNDITLCEHALAVTKNNYKIHQNYGGALINQNRIDEAIVQFKEALRLRPTYYKAAYSLGRLYMQQKKYGQAEKYLRQVVDIYPYHSWANYRLGVVLLSKGSHQSALKYLEQAIKINPLISDAHFAIAKIYYLSSKFDLVIDYCNQNLIYCTDSVPLRLLISRALAEQNRYLDAVAQYFQAFRLEPDRVYTLKSIALILATVDDDKIYDPAAAVRLAERACELTNYNDSKALAILAVACSNKADFERAQKMVQKAIDISKPLNQQQLSNELQKQLLLYKNNQPFRQKTEILKPDFNEIES